MDIITTDNNEIQSIIREHFENFSKSVWHTEHTKRPKDPRLITSNKVKACNTCFYS